MARSRNLAFDCYSRSRFGTSLYDEPLNHPERDVRWLIRSVADYAPERIVVA